MYDVLQEVKSCVIGYTGEFDQKAHLHIIAEDNEWRRQGMLLTMLPVGRGDDSKAEFCV